MAESMIGGYGTWASSLLAGKVPSLSFRREEFTDVDQWRPQARQRVLERMAVPEVAGPKEVEVVETLEYDGLHVERLQWQLPYGPPTEAVLLKPVGATGKLPGVLTLHCHGGRKCWGKRKVAQWADPHPLVAAHHEQYYGGRAWANALAKRGYVVLAHDAFAFASRRVRLADCPQVIRRDGVEPDEARPQTLDAYNEWAAWHESIMAKSLFCAGTTWPGVFFAEDRIALDILAARDDVDEARLGCGGLSGGGLRTGFLAGLDERIRCCVAVGFMSTWSDFLLHKSHTHTWMLYVPLLPKELDYPEILGLRVPAATMVMNTTEDQLYTLESVRQAEGILREIFAKAGAEENLDFRYYPGPHKFDVEMQEDAFDFFDRWLK